MNEVWIMSQFSSYQGVKSSLNDFRVLAPESDILMRDLSDYENSDFGTNSTSSAGFSVLLGFDLKDKKGTRNGKKTFRLGFSYGNHYSLYHNLSQTRRYPVDTLISTQTGEEYYVDSVSTKNISMEYSSQNIILDASFIFRTDAEARWSLYGGIGASFGVNLNPRVDIFYNTFNFPETSNNDIPEVYYSDFASETYSSELGITGGLYLPGGVDFRLGNNPFWHRTHLVYELRPSVLISDIPELQSYAQLGFVQSLVLRVRW